MPKYERLNTNNADDEDGTRVVGDQRSARFHEQGGVGGIHDDDESEEVELELGLAQRAHGSKHRYEKNGSGGGGGSPNFRYVNNISTTKDSLPTADHGSARIMQMAVGTLVTILLYLTLSITLTFYQKDIIKTFKFPLTIVSYHLVLKFLLAVCVRHIMKSFLGKSRVELDCRIALRKMAPTGIASGIDIGFSNWGLELVPISLYTMTKSSTIVFILFFAILLGLEKKSWSLVFIVGLIAAGLFMFTYKSTQFNALGFIFILFASLSSGVRWSFAQFIMQKSKLGLHNPIDMIYHMQPWMVASILPFLVGFEGEKLYNVVIKMNAIPNDVIVNTIAKITLGAILAFLMEVSEFMVLSKTSSLTLSIAGIFKDICQLALAVELNGDQLTLINVLGLVVCLAGICCHLVHKYASLAKLEELHSFDHDADDEIDVFGMSESNTVNNINGTPSESVSHNKLQQHHNATDLRVPLLEQTDTDDESDNALGKASASDVIFDVLKRRDM